MKTTLNNMKKAILIKDNLENFNGHAALYQLSEPMKVTDWDDNVSFVDYVVLSTANVFGIETYIFAANENGKVTDWFELDGSRKGTASHSDVLSNAGYKVYNLDLMK